MEGELAQLTVGVSGCQIASQTWENWLISDLMKIFLSPGRQ